MCKVGRRILLVEDTKSISILLEATLKREGYLLQVASCYKEADQLIRKMLRGSFRYDLALVDMNLPDGDGIDLLRQLQSQNVCRVKFMVSADASRAARARAFAAGADDFIIKPFELGSLLRKIEDKVGKRHVVEHRETTEDLLAMKNKLAAEYRAHLLGVSREMAGVVSFPVLCTRLHQIRGSAMLYGFKSLSKLASNLSSKLKSDGPGAAAEIRGKLRHAILTEISD